MEQETPIRDLEYLHGLREAVSRGVGYGIEVLEVGEDRAASIPTALHAQPRLAARHRVPLDMVLRRLIASKTLLAHFMLEEASRMGLSNPDFFHAAAISLEAVFDQLLTIAQDEYRREEERRLASPDARILRHVQLLLDGEVREWLFPRYGAEGQHLGLVATSPEAHTLIRLVARSMDLSSLLLTPWKGEVWAWLGSATPIDIEILCKHLTANAEGSLSIGIGRSEGGVAGWRLTHRQAKAARSIGVDGSITNYEEVALLAALSRDPLLATSLRDMFLMPLSCESGRSQVLRATLKAYFEANRNRSSAASALGVSRQTVANHLQTVEERLNQPLSTCGDLLHATLTLEERGYIASF